jgi:hypothetical protein
VGIVSRRGSTRPRWSPANSPVTYTSDEVTALDRYRQKVEAVGPRAESYDLFLCHAWDDRRRTAAELHDLLEAQDVSVWFSERDIILGQSFMREIDKGLAKTRIGLVLITPAFLKRIESGGVSEKELSELLARDLLIPVSHGVTYQGPCKVSFAWFDLRLWRPAAEVRPPESRLCPRPAWSVLGSYPGQSDLVVDLAPRWPRLDT